MRSPTDVSRIPGTCSSPSRVCSHRLTSREFSTSSARKFWGKLSFIVSNHRYATSSPGSKRALRRSGVLVLKIPGSRRTCSGGEVEKSVPPPQAGRDRAAFGGVASASNFWAQIHIHGGVVADVPNQPLSRLLGSTALRTSPHTQPAANPLAMRREV